MQVQQVKLTSTGYLVNKVEVK